MPEALFFGCLVVGAILIVPLIWLAATYNRLVSVRQHLRESWSGVDVELKRRYDLVPNLVKTVQGYAAHERSLFERVAEIRSEAARVSATGHASGRLEGELSRELHRLVAVAERYPELKADRHFLELQKELALTEDRIAAARRFYNANVRELNTLCSTVPSSVVAGLFGFGPEEFFQLDGPGERAAPSVDSGLRR
jgi:LemA protein